MKFKLFATALLLGTGIVTSAGCASRADAEDPEAEASTTSEAELNRYSEALVGAYHGDFATTPPSIEGLVLRSDRTYFADVDTGIRCVMAPCPSHVRVEGKFYATRSYLYLGADGEETGGIKGWYRYDLDQGHKLVLRRLGRSNWEQSLSPEGSYCKEASDCANQGIIHIMGGIGIQCVGDWKCNSDATCSFECGKTDVVWPTNATQLVAQNHGGGFTPPPPPGSNCAFGAAKYTLDVATKSLEWERCEFIDWNQPMTQVTGSKTLTAAEYAQVEAGIKEVSISEQNACGADKPMLSLYVSTPTGTTEYKDDFYSCWGNGPFVSNIEAVFSAMREVTK